MRKSESCKIRLNHLKMKLIPTFRLKEINEFKSEDLLRVYRIHAQSRVSQNSFVSFKNETWYYFASASSLYLGIFSLADLS
jgi:hypothetical protein